MGRCAAGAAEGVWGRFRALIANDEHLRSVADLFSAAALDGDWPAALSAMARAVGAQHGELIGLGPEAAVFSYWTGFDPACLKEWTSIGGFAPAANPRVAMGGRLPLMTAWHEVRCTTDAELRRSPLHADYCRRWDIPYGSQTTLLRGDGLLVGLSTPRSEAQGVPGEDDRRAFEALAPAARAAVLTQMALENQGARFIQGAMEALGVAAFVLDGIGRVRALTPAAETAVVEGPLRLAQGRLGAVRAEDARRLADAIDGALAGEALRTLVLRGVVFTDVELVEVAALPTRPYAFGFQPRVLVAMRSAARRDIALPGILSAAYGLTPSEAEIAVALADGETRELIAARRATSIQTLRSQIKRIFAKLDVRRESQLAARLQRLR